MADEKPKTRRKAGRRDGTARAAKITTPEDVRQRALDEARTDVEQRVEANERLHREAQRKGEKLAPHKQDRRAERMIADRPAEEGTTVLVKVGHDPDHPAEVGQEDLGMGPIKVQKAGKKGIGGGAIQPGARSRSAWTLPTTTKEDGKTNLLFTNPSSGTALGTQAAKATGGQQVQSGGAGAGTGTVFSDVPAGSAAALPTFSDRVATDSDINAGGVVASGAVNLPRAEMPDMHVADRPKKGVVEVGANRPRLPERIESDRLASSEEEMTSVVTPERPKDKPHTGGGELLGMGETHFLGGAQDTGATMQVDRVTVHEEAIVGAPKETLASKDGAKTRPKAAKAAAKPSRRAKSRAARRSRSKPAVVRQEVKQKDPQRSGAPKPEVKEIPIAEPDTRPPDEANADARPPEQANAESTHQEPGE